MKRIAATIIILIFFIFVAIVVAAWINPDFKTSVDTALAGAGGEIYLRAQGAWLNLMTLATANGTTFLAYTLGILVVGGIALVSFKTFLWDRRPSWLGNTNTSKLPQVREEPRDIIITQNPVPTTPDKKEAPVTEQTSTAS